MVSIIITTYGGNRKLERAINSVLVQTYIDFEIIVVDDNNPMSDARNKTKLMMQQYEKLDNLIYVQHEKNMNGAFARNTGVKFSKGCYIAFLDDDDIYMPDRLKKMVEIMETDEMIDGVCCGVALIKENLITGIISQKNEKILTPVMLFENQNIIGTGSNIFIKKDVFWKLKGFDTGFLRFQDIEFMIRASKVGKIRFCEEVLVIKDSSDARLPNYIKVNNALQKFNEAFADDISMLSSASKQAYYNDRYLFLLMLAKLDGNYKEIVDVCNTMVELKVNEQSALRIYHKAKIIALFWKCREVLKRNVAKKLYQMQKNIGYKKSDRLYSNLIGNDKYMAIKQCLRL